MRKFPIAAFFLLFNLNLHLGGHTIGLLPAFLGYFFMYKACRRFDRVDNNLGALAFLAAGMTITELIFYLLKALGYMTLAAPLLAIGTLLGLAIVVFFLCEVMCGMERMDELVEPDIHIPPLKRAFMVLLGVSCVRVVLLFAAIFTDTAILDLIGRALYFLGGLVFWLCLIRSVNAFVAAAPEKLQDCL